MVNKQRTGRFSLAYEASRQPRIGFKKSDILPATYRAVGVEANKAHFNVVFLESCKSFVSAGGKLTVDKSQTAIGALFGSDKAGLKYNTIKYGELVKAMRSNGWKFGEALTQQLESIDVDR